MQALYRHAFTLLALSLTASGCRAVQPPPQEGSTTGQGETGMLTSSAPTMPDKSTSAPLPDPGIPSQPFPKTSSLDLGTLTWPSTQTSTGDTQPLPDPARDCDKISWGEDLEEGAIIARGDIQGYMDQNGDGKLDQKPTQVGMCELHLTGKRCALVIYSRWG